MKRGNFDRAQRLVRKIVKGEDALGKIKKWKDKYGNVDSDGSTGAGKELYDIHLCEHQDGSGIKVDLSGLMVGVYLLSHAEDLINVNLKIWEEELETL